MNKVLITGGAGFIGSVVTEKLCGKPDFSVLSLDDHFVGLPFKVLGQNIENVVCDI